MLRTSVIGYVGYCLLFSIAVGHAAPPTETEIEQAVERLGADKLSEREQATKLLWEAGAAAEPALRKAAASSDAEVRLRARSILEKFKSGIFADTPPHVVALLKQFRYGDLEEKRKALEQVVAAGESRRLLSLLDAQSDDELRLLFQQGKASGVRLLVAQLLESGGEKQADRLMELVSQEKLGLFQLTTYFLVRGQVEERIARLKAHPYTATSDRAKLLLVLLYRANGDLAEVRNLLPTVTDIPLRLMLQMECGDWAGAIESHLAIYQKNIDGVEAGAHPLGLLSGFHQLSGNTEKANEIIRKIKELGEKNPAHTRSCVNVLLLNDHPTEAFALLKDKYPITAFEFLVDQHRLEEALTLVKLGNETLVDRKWLDTLPEQGSGEDRLTISRLDFAHQLAKQLYGLGRKEVAGKIFDALRQAATEDASGTQQARLLKLSSDAYSVGYVDGACEFLALAMEGLAADEDLLEGGVTFGESHSSQANIWWQVLRPRCQDEPRQKTLRRVHDLLTAADAKQPPDSVREALAGLSFEQAITEAKVIAESEEESTRDAMLISLANVCDSFGDRVRGEQLLTQAAKTAPFGSLRLGDHFAEAEQWEKAAQSYQQAWEMNHDFNFSLLLASAAWKKIERNDEAQRLKLRANLVAMEPASRYQLAIQLKIRGFMEEAVRQMDLLQRTAPQADNAYSLSAELLGTELITKDNARAAKLLDRRRILLMATNFNFLTTYIRPGMLVHKARALAAIEKQDFETARREVETAWEAVPGDVSLAEDVIPALDKAGQTEAASLLFQRTYGILDRICTTFPDSSMHRNNLAWLAARSNRRLDDALMHSLHANKLTPHSATYLDTLAEVQFRRRNREEAVKLSARCIELNPTFQFFRKQIERFRNEPFEGDGAK